MPSGSWIEVCLVSSGGHTPLCSGDTVADLFAQGDVADPPFVPFLLLDQFGRNWR